MIPKYSVKKPMTVFVAMIVILVMGVMAFIKMPVDLLPSINLPYIAIMTTYPGATPEKVEQGVTGPIESAVATAGGVEQVTSISAENYSMVIMQFAESTNIDSAMLEVSSKIDLVEGYFDDMVSAPVLLKINPDMIPAMVASVDMDGMDQEEISEFASDDLIKEFERIEGVASVSSIGLVESKLEVTLEQDKIDALNKKLKDAAQKKLDEAKAEIDKGADALKEAQDKLDSETEKQTRQMLDAQKELESGRSQLVAGINTIEGKLSEVRATRSELKSQIAALDEAFAGMKAMGMEPTEEQLQGYEQLKAGYDAATGAIGQMEGQLPTLKDQLSQLDQAKQQLEAGKITASTAIASAQAQITVQQSQLTQAQEQFEQGKETALSAADLSGMLTKDAIMGILTAQNFAMPAGSIDKDGTSIAVKVGEGVGSQEELEDLVLFDTGTEEVGIVRLSDVAKVEKTDNREDLYAKINGNDGILFTISKQSNASTVEVCHAINDRFAELTEKYEGLHITALSDQGVYIDIVVRSVIENLLLGGVLAILVLLLFLRSIRPTVVVALSIPLSLLFAVALMYFTGVSLNVISLAGLAMGVGMLVDNSIVVIENIYRLRTEGLPVKEAASEGAKQVAGAIAASTLTTICVFLPIVFTEGLSRELFTDMGLTIAFSLIASLGVALTLVPAMASGVLTKGAKPPRKGYLKVLNGYGKLLRGALKCKWLVLLVAAALLAVSLWGAVSLGTAFLPDADSYQISVTLEMPDGATKKDTRKTADDIAKIAEEIPGVATVGAMEGGGLLSFGSSGGSGDSVSMYILLDEEREMSAVEIGEELINKTEDMDCTVSVMASMTDMMSMLGGSGIEIRVEGDNIQKLQRTARKLAKILESVEGTENVSDGTEKASPELMVTVDKEKAAESGLTVAQVYQQISNALTLSSEATTVTMNSRDYSVLVNKDEGDAVTTETLKDLELDGTKQQEKVKVKLGDVAQITNQSSLSTIGHTDGVRYITVSAEIDAQHNIGLVSRELEKKLEGFEVPEGYSYEVSGENETINDALEQLGLMLLLAIVLIYLIMVAQFQSLKSPLIVMFTIPLAFTGGLLMLWICKMELSVIAMLGFIVLAGVVVNNGIVFVDCANQLREGGMKQHDALVEAGKMRMRPIMMTAITTILGLFPLAFGMGMGADLIQPMAVVIIGGLTYATLLTLLVVPALYDALNRRNRKKEEKQAVEALDIQEV